MVKDPKTGSLRPAKDASALLELVPELEKHIDLDFYPLFNIDSSNMNPGHWEIIGQKIHELYKKYDGFVVAQGTDTMAYSASAVAFMLQNLGKPVVFTGSIVPMSELGADGRNNLIYSCLTAGLDLAEVCIVFGCKIVRGCRAKKNHESFVDVFDSPNFPLLGEIERPVRLFKWRRKRHTKPLKFMPGFEKDIRLVKLFPGYPMSSLDRMLENGAKGIVVEGFGPGNIPFLENSILPFLEKAKKLKVPVVITSQMERSVTNLRAYEAGYKALELGAISANDMTTEATISKFMWVLAQTHDIKKIRQMMESNITGELSDSEDTVE